MLTVKKKSGRCGALGTVQFPYYASPQIYFGHVLIQVVIGVVAKNVPYTLSLITIQNT
jgi:hypothetical protein